MKAERELEQNTDMNERRLTMDDFSISLPELKKKLLSMRLTKKQMKECDLQGSLIAYGWTDCLNKLLEWVKINYVLELI